MVVSTFLPVHDDTSEVCDLRQWSEQQLLPTAKTLRRAPYGELCERYDKKVFGVIHPIMRNRENAEDEEDAVQDCLLNVLAHVKDF